MTYIDVIVWILGLWAYFANMVLCNHNTLELQEKKKQNTDHTEKNNDIILNKFIDTSVKNCKL